jgi:hypothetical protein
MLALLLACHPAPDLVDSATRDSGASDTADSGLDPATVPLGGACPLATRFGGFEVAMNEGYSTVGGAVADGVVPIAVLTEAAREGECVLLRRENPFCDPACDAGETCDFDGTCVPYPTNQDLGVVTLDGLAEPLALSPVAPGNTYFDTTLPHPVVAPDAAVALSAEGGPFGPFDLHGVGPEPLVVTTLDWVIGAGPLALAWDAPVGLGRSRVQLRLTVDQHGLTPLTLVCDLSDTGAAEVPESLMNELLISGVSGYPNGLLSRQTIDSTPVGAGCADLAVRYDVLPTVSVEGHTPCDGHDDCPFGQHCNFALETCE